MMKESEIFEFDYVPEPGTQIPETRQHSETESVIKIQKELYGLSKPRRIVTRAVLARD